MTTRVLVATDLHPAADEAIRQAHAWAGTEDAFAVSHVLPNLQPISLLFPQRHQAAIFDVVELLNRAENAVRQRVAQLTGRAPDSFEVFIDQGVDYAEITRRAAAWKADVVFVGNHNDTPLEHLLIGSTTERVARYCQCAVLVARPSPSTGPVIAATDLSDPSLPAIHAGAREASRRKAPLTVVNAIDFMFPPAIAAGGFFGLVPTTYSAEAIVEMEKDAKAKLDATLKTAKVEGEARVLVGDAVVTIVSEVAERQAQLVVVATHGRTGLAHVALGSVAEKVMRNASCSVLVVRLATT